MKTVFILLVVAFCSLPAHADTISYSDSGTFSTSTASSAFTGPGETWAFSFQADSNPTVLEFGNGGFNFSFSNFSYSLNGSTVAITPSFIRFFSPGNGGGFEICFAGTTVQNCTDGLGSTGFGPPMYTGTTSSPTLAPGTYGPYGLGFLVNSVAYSQADTSVAANSVPEPSTLLMLAMGFLAFVSIIIVRLGQQVTPLA